MPPYLPPPSPSFHPFSLPSFSPLLISLIISFPSSFTFRCLSSPHIPSLPFYLPSISFLPSNYPSYLFFQMRDLRHENINGFLGMLCDPIRPGLVMEYCSRKSLEDIIRQEDIKLDWSFRLSLLTDLVRVSV